MRDCENQSEFASQILTLFEISCDDVVWHIGFFYKLSRFLSESGFF